jgi:hypothetical protein
MQKQTTTVNRKWINQAFKSASREGTYFTGITSRDVAHDIVQKLSMHPAFVGKLDELMMELFEQGAYAIVDCRLVRSDNIAQHIDAARRWRVRHQIARRAARQTRQRNRALNAEWHAEAVA